jgi:hypothetical protein
MSSPAAAPKAAEGGAAKAAPKADAPELEEMEKQESFSKPKKRPRGRAIKLEVVRVNLLQLGTIDHMIQQFTARYFVQLR